MSIPYKCPVCDGTGRVSRPPEIAGDIEEWSASGSGPYECRACSGTGIVWEIKLIIPHCCVCGMVITGTHICAVPR